MSCSAPCQRRASLSVAAGSSSCGRWRGQPSCTSDIWQPSAPGPMLMANCLARLPTGSLSHVCSCHGRASLLPSRISSAASGCVSARTHQTNHHGGPASLADPRLAGVPSQALIRFGPSTHAHPMQADRQCCGRAVLARCSRRAMPGGWSAARAAAAAVKLRCGHQAAGRPRSCPQAQSRPVTATRSRPRGAAGVAKALAAHAAAKPEERRALTTGPMYTHKKDDATHWSMIREAPATRTCRRSTL